MNKKMSNYPEVAKRSFKSKWRIYLFDKVINSKLYEINQNNFGEYELKDESIRKYVNEYWQEFDNYEINGKSILRIHEEIKNFEKNNSSEIREIERNYAEREFPQILSKADFEELKKEDKCRYCGITMEEIEKLGESRKLRKKNLRGWSFEIDRLEPNKEYSKENCVMSCYWCNNAKTDEFSESEFMPIGREIG
ncbi:MAG: hypothetical protein R2852_10170, partial [Bacteroidia bacterium]